MRTAVQTRTHPLLVAAVSVLMALAAMLAFASDAIPAVNQVNDETIREAVEDELVFDRFVSFNDIDVTVNKGIVVLRGQVDNALAQDRASRIATTVKGVVGVDNRIEVVPPEGISEDELAERVKAALKADPAADTLELAVSVDGNMVTLKGSVESWQEKRLAEKVVRSVTGVAMVLNHINIEYTASRPDLEIRNDVEQRLAFDVLVDHALIEVAVDDSVVELGGAVGSAAEKAEAVSDAWVAGVSDVHADELEVVNWGRDPLMRKEKYAPRENEEVETAIRNSLTLDPRVSEFDVAVKFRDGTARVFGIVDNVKAKRVAERIARETVGVRRVENRIQVRPETDLDDEEIEDMVQLALDTDPYLEGYEVEAEVIGGIAYLHGVVDSYFERAQAKDTASSLNGVKAVKNNLVVSDFGANFDPYVDGAYVYEPGPMGPTDLEVTFLSDSEIKKAVRDEIWWSPYVDSDHVQVSVDDAVVTLEGGVESWTERMFARQEAIEAGADDVINKIRIKD